MNTLAIDTSSKNILIYANVSDSISSIIVNKTNSSNLTVTLPTIFSNFIKENNISLNDINLIINSCGPGSFTGLRISLSFVKGLSIGLSIPFVNVPTLDVFAYSLNSDLDILSLNDNIKGRYYFAHYKNSKMMGEVTDASEEELFRYIDMNIEKGIIVGNNTENIFEAFKNKLDLVKDNSRFGESLTELGVSMHLNNPSSNGYILSSPLYVRSSDAEIKLKGLK